MLKVCLLGTVQALLDEQPITGFVSNKVRALLAYLSVEIGRPHSREALASLLWPDRTQSSAEGNLRCALSNLRKLLRPAGTELLAVSRQSVQFRCTDQVSIDVGVFQNLLNNGQNELLELETIETAVGLYRGEFLEGLTIGDSAAFEEWCAVRREQFHRQMLEALHYVAEAYVQRGEYARARQYAWRALELEPWDEEGHRQLMRALIFDGHREAALAQYAKCREVLAQELDIEPSPETQRLFEEIRYNKWIGAEHGIRGGNRGVTTNLPVPLTSFIGRKRELADIEKLLDFQLDTEREPSTRLLTFVGAGGCGKTRTRHRVGPATVDSKPLSEWCLVGRPCTAERSCPGAPDRSDALRGMQPTWLLPHGFAHELPAQQTHAAPAR